MAKLQFTASSLPALLPLSDDGEPVLGRLNPVTLSSRSKMKRTADVDMPFPRSHVLMGASVIFR